ncbi:MAG TPA: GAF domain-containing protein [Candidatus Angelobacter sp.]|nr:GAF domain-containing protein [Candidatus Angelobacter sp.]
MSTQESVPPVIDGFLHEIGGFFPSTSFEKLSSTTLLPEFLKSAMEVSRACFGNIQLFDPGRRALRIATHHGFKEEFLRYFAEVRTSNSSCGAAMNRGARVIVPDVCTHPIFKDKEPGEMLLRAGVLATQSTPLVSSAGQFLGMMNTHYSQPRDFCEPELQELDLVTRRYVAMMEATLREAAVQERTKVRLD